MPTGIYTRKRIRNNVIDCGDYLKVELTNRKKEVIAQTLIDKEDYEKIKDRHWNLGKNGYVDSANIPARIYLHHLVFGKVLGKEIDHINENPLDNRKSNLRFVSRSRNNLNRKRTTGCWFRKDTKRWSAEITVDGKKYSLGCADTLKEAKKVREDFKIKNVIYA